jgi:flavin-dependent dehydrogenase
VRGRTAGRVLLVGDAAGYVDALTGEGLRVAFSATELLANCIAADRVGDYDRQWCRMSRRYRLLTPGVLYASAQTPLRLRIVPAANTFPVSSLAWSTCSPNSAAPIAWGAGTTSARCGRNPPPW